MHETGEGFFADFCLLPASGRDGVTFRRQGTGFTRAGSET